MKAVSWFFSLKSKVIKLVVGKSSGLLSTVKPIGFNFIKKKKKRKGKRSSFYKF